MLSDWFDQKGALGRSLLASWMGREKFCDREPLRGHSGYLWNVPAHRAAWRAVAAQEGGADQLYHRWCHHLDTDCIYQLNSVLGILPESALSITA